MRAQLPPYFSIPRPTPSPTAAPIQQFKVKPPNAVAEGDVLIQSLTQYKDGPVYKLRGNAQVETNTALLKGDEIDYNEDTGDAEARGHVYLLHFSDGEELWADHAFYNATAETGKFYDVRGSSLPRIESRPGVLTTANPFYFEGKWAERLKEKYILHDGFVTDCKKPNPWWVQRGPLFDIIPYDRALAYRTSFWLKGKVPVFWAPFYYKSLSRLPRKSGFLLPNIGNSSSRGLMFGLGYYWAINRSYDLMYRGQDFTSRGLANNLAFRARPNETTELSAVFYGVDDRQNQGGTDLKVFFKSDLGDGFYARADVDYLSSFLFRQVWSESYSEGVSSEVNSSGFIEKDWSSYGLAADFQRLANFQSTTPTDTPSDTIVIRKLPEVDFNSRDRQISPNLPIWVSWDTSAALIGRSDPSGAIPNGNVPASGATLITPEAVDRIDLYPHITAAFHWGGFSLIPGLSLRDTQYGESQNQWCFDGKNPATPGASAIGSCPSGSVAIPVAAGQNLNRFAHEFDFTLLFPPLERVYDGPRWFPHKIKHVIEPKATYQYVGGIGDDFLRLVRFDDTELYSDTNQLELSLTNRLFVKRKDGTVDEALTWELVQDRYFDPTFGGAIISGQRNVVLSSVELTPFAFLDQPRNYSPVASILRTSPRPGVSFEWRADYDPLLGRLMDSGFSVFTSFGKYFFSVGQNTVHSDPLLTAAGYPMLTAEADQINGSFHIGNQTRRGWNAGIAWIYDLRQHVLTYAITQMTYNTDCCGLSLQFGRANYGFNDDTILRFSFTIANLGSVGSMRKQERLF